MFHLSSSDYYQTGSTLLLYLLGTLLATALALPLAFTSIQAVGVRTSISAETRGNYHPLSPGKLPSIIPRKIIVQYPPGIYHPISPTARRSPQLQVQVIPYYHTSSPTQEYHRCYEPIQWRQEVVQLRPARSDEQMLVDPAISDRPRRHQSRQRKYEPGTQRGIWTLYKWATNQEG